MKITEKGIVVEYNPTFDIVKISYDIEKEVIIFNVTLYIDNAFTNEVTKISCCLIDIDQRDKYGKLKEYKDILEELIYQGEKEIDFLKRELEGKNHFNMIQKMIAKETIITIKEEI